MSRHSDNTSGLVKVIGWVFFVFFVLPSLCGILWYIMMSPFRTPEENIQEGVKLMVDAAIPWWVEPMKAASKLPQIFGTIVVVGIALCIQFGLFPSS